MGMATVRTRLPFPREIHQYPSALSLLDGLNTEFGKLLPSEDAANQKRQNHIVPASLSARAVGDSRQLFGLLAGQPVSTGSLSGGCWGMSVRLAAASGPIMLFLLASPTIFRTAESRTFIAEGESDFMLARHSITRERGRLDRRRTAV
jgi:hypothetical protein